MAERFTALIRVKRKRAGRENQIVLLKEMKRRYEQEERRELYCPKVESGEMSRKSEKMSLIGKNKQKRRQEICD